MTDLDTPEQQAYRDGYAQGKADAEREAAKVHKHLTRLRGHRRRGGDDARCDTCGERVCSNTCRVVRGSSRVPVGRKRR